MRGIQVHSIGSLTHNRFDEIAFRATVGGAIVTNSAAYIMMGQQFCVGFHTVASVLEYTVKNNDPRAMYVTRAYGYMTGAGAALDTAVVNCVHNATANHITDVADLSVFADTEQFDFSEINDLYNTVLPGDSLQVVTVSDALCDIIVEGFWLEV